METKINWDELQRIDKRVCKEVDEEFALVKQYLGNNEVEEVVLAGVLWMNVENRKITLPRMYATGAYFFGTILLLRKLGFSKEKCEELYNHELPSDEDIVRRMSGLMPNDKRWREPRALCLEFEQGRSISK